MYELALKEYATDNIFFFFVVFKVLDKMRTHHHPQTAEKLLFLDIIQCLLYKILNNLVPPPLRDYASPSCSASETSFITEGAVPFCHVKDILYRQYL